MTSSFSDVAIANNFEVIIDYLVTKTDDFDLNEYLLQASLSAETIDSFSPIRKPILECPFLVRYFIAETIPFEFIKVHLLRPYDG